MRDFNNIKNCIEEQNISLSLIDIFSINDRLERYGCDVYRNLFAAWESFYLDNLRFVKRKSEFISGRLAGKRAVKEYLVNFESLNVNSLRFNDLEIRKSNTGEPIVLITNNHTDLLISISHSGAIAASIVSNGRDYRGIGIDIEKIERRDESFLNVGFNQSEIENLNNCNKYSAKKLNSRIDEDITRYWTIKESILKSLGIGLKADLKDIEILDPDEGIRGIRMKDGVEQWYNHLEVRDLTIESFKIANDYIMSISYLN